MSDLIATARAGSENLSPGEVADEISRGGVLLVDVREPTETAHGVIPGAVMAPRGMLEFHADLATPYHLDDFDRHRRTIVYCAAGSRSAPAVTALQRRAEVALHQGRITFAVPAAIASAKAGDLPT